LSTATTCGPAPIANRLSVAVGESETIRRGFVRTVTLPWPVTIVTGNAVGAERDGAEALEAAMTRAADTIPTARSVKRST
jgi:hypothetical protein